ncbi:hypothetical protein [Okeania sp. SIO2B3]|uniref:hypothetical protein n=1 Tax=Okeania sp. SIO2B3 TaxID=2607784 RepID=UPI0013C0F919|nr:hypothetical protein [Okeania sp. SIO2B3]NET40604.1 hypothetical protein [Okeania sp. SIO2B3]
MDVNLLKFVRLRDSVKLSRTCLQGTCLGTSVCSFFLWLIPPFTTQNHTIRIGSLFLGFGLSSAGLISSQKLQQHRSLYEALDLAEKTAFNQHLAELTYNPPLACEESQSGYFSEYDATDVPEPLQPEIVPDCGSSNSSPEFSGKLILEIKKELELGTSDTRIIKEVLHCSGRKWDEGKAKLAEIKTLIQDLKA